MANILNQSTHADLAGVRLCLYVDMRAFPEAVKALHSASCARIAAKVAAGSGQVFEEGPVYMQCAPRHQPNVDTGRACLYTMDFGEPSTTNCARMHVHPFGERILLVTPVSSFRIWSLIDFDVNEDLGPMTTELPVYMCPESGKTVFGIEIQAGTLFTAQIPKGTTHRFFGKATAVSIHPDETSELSQLASAASSMEEQTTFWSRYAPVENECHASSICYL